MKPVVAVPTVAPPDTKAASASPGPAGCEGTDGVTVRLSRFTLPESVLSKAYATVWSPAVSVTDSVADVQVSQFADAGSDTWRWRTLST